MTRLRIVHTESSLGWGGQEIRILSESRGMIERGHAVKLLCPAEACIHAEAPGWGVPAVALPVARKGVRGLRALVDWLRENPCDIVNTHSSTDAWLAALAMFTLGRPAPIVRTRHTSAPVPKNPATRWLYEKGAQRIVTTGEALKRPLVQVNGFDPERIEAIPTGIDAARFVPGDRRAAREMLGLPRDSKLVGVVATLRSWKGHRTLIDAMGQLPAEVKLVVVGEGPMRETLEARIAALSLGERVHFAGDHAEVLLWLQALDVFTLPSYAKEGVPQALVQAMLVGLPCIATTAGSIAELATHEATALVVPAQDAHALACAIERLLGDPVLASRLGAAARAHCTARFSYAGMLDRMEAVYQELVEAKAQAAG